MHSFNALKKMRLESGSLTTLEDANSNRYEDENRRKIGAKCTGLLDLNNDCLNAILEYVSIIDLCSIAETCSSLKTVGCEMFERKNKIFTFNKATTRTTIEARKIFKTFGVLMNSLDIDFRSCPKSTVIMDAVTRYCTSLESLTLTGYYIPDNQEKISDLGKLFQNLQTLHIGLVSIEGIDETESSNDKNLTTPNGNVVDLFVECQSLLHLEVEHCEYLNRVIFESGFYHLQSFEYFGYDIGCLIDGFTLRHKYLKSFSLIQIESEGGDDHLPALKVIAANCKNLEKLRFDFGRSGHRLAEYEAFLKRLSMLKYFRELRVDYIENHINILVSILPSFRDTLEVLGLDMAEATRSYGLIRAISELSKLRLLRLNNCCVLDDLTPLGELTELSALSIGQIEEISKFELVPLVDRLINLRNIQLYVGNFKIGIPTYFQLVDAVERRKDVAKRTLQIDCPTTHDFADTQVTTVEFVKFKPHQI